MKSYESAMAMVPQSEFGTNDRLSNLVQSMVELNMRGEDTDSLTERYLSLSLYGVSLSELCALERDVAEQVNRKPVGRMV